jgi:excisionase family DNA binding protein
MGISLDLETVLEVLAERVAAKVSERTLDAGTAVRHRLFTVDQAADYLACTPDAIRHKVAAGALPAVRIDRKLRFDIRDLDRVIHEKKSGEQ